MQEELISEPQRYFAIHKPYHMLSQFRGGHPGMRMLCDLTYDFPEGTHAVGRLDHTSEGLLIATTDKSITKKLFESGIPHKRTYIVQAYKSVSSETLDLLRNGIEISAANGGMYTTQACEIEIIDRPAFLPVTTYELRADIAQTWMTISLTEGKFRQIRKMLQSANHPCRRLVRTSIEDMQLGALKAGEVKEITKEAFYSLLKI